MLVTLERVQEPGAAPLRRRLLRVGPRKLWVGMSHGEAGFRISDGKPAEDDWKVRHLRVSPASLEAVKRYYHR